MARYIDADEYRKRLEMICGDGYSQRVTAVYIEWFMSIADSIAVDEPVTHAHWVPIESSLHVEKSGACSECGEAWPLSDTEYFYRCPNCGAKMDEEV